MDELKQVYAEFPKGIKEKFIEASNYVLERYVFKAWNREEMKEKWRRRSIFDISDSKEINHLFPCVDAGVIAASYFIANRENAKLKLLTERGAVDAFNKGKSRAFHIDALVELPYQGINYGVNIGCGDVILYKQIPSDSSDPLEEKFLTTRPETNERYWYRTPFLVVGEALRENHFDPILDFLEMENEVKVPYDIRNEQFYEAPAIGDKKSFLDTNGDYDPEASSKDNREWLFTNKEFLPGLREYRYE